MVDLNVYIKNIIKGNLMKTILLLLLLALPIFATKQISEVLYDNGKEYYFWNYYPLNSLKLNYPPFYDVKTKINHTACYRGYQGEWMIENDSLFLISINDCAFDGNNKYQNLKTLFEMNDIKPIYSLKKVFADWVSDNFYLKGENIIISNEHYKKYYTQSPVRLFLIIKNGVITNRYEKALK